MDVVTQAIFGAAAGQSVAGRRLPRSAWVIGALAGYLPDADIFIRFENDSLSTWLIHRHFTHGFGFWPIGAALVMIVWGLVVLASRRSKAVDRERGELRQAGWWGMGFAAALAGIMTHGVLDACTSFGTMMWWPVSFERVSWDLVAIIDPLVSLPMLGLVIASVVMGSKRGREGRLDERKDRKRFELDVRSVAIASLVWAVVYIGGLGLIQRERAMEAQRRIAEAGGDSIERGRVLMAPLQNYVFRSVYLSQGLVKSDLIRVPWWPWGEAKYIPAEHPKTLLLDERAIEGLNLPEEVMRDARRFSAFTQEWGVLHPEVPMAIADARYGLGTRSMASLWYLDLQPQRSSPGTQETTRLVREMGRIDRQRDELIGILLGHDPRLIALP